MKNSGHSQYTYQEIAEDTELWKEYVDPNATMTDEEIEALSTKQKIEMQIEMFGVGVPEWYILKPDAND